MQCGFDRAELRRRNMAPTPMTNTLGFTWTAAILRGPSIERWSGPMSPAFPRGAATARRAVCARPGLRLPHQGHRRIAAPERRYRFEADGTVSRITGTQT